MALKDAPLLQELPIVAIENGVKTIYSFEIQIQQQDMGYDPLKAGTGALAQQDVAVYADTVTLNEPLTLPGKNLSIYARRLVLGKGVAIDVSGAPATSSFAPGDFPQQTDMTAGANGSPGGGATSGGNAGSVTVAVDEIVGTDAGTFGKPQIEAVNLTQELAQRFQQAAQKMGPVTMSAFSAPIQYYYSGGMFGNNTPNPYPFKYLIGTLAVPAAAVGLGTIKVEDSSFSGDGKSVTVTFSAKDLKVAFSSSLDINQSDSGVSGKPSIPLASLPFTLQAGIAVQVDASAGMLAGAQVTVSAAVRLEQTPKLAGNLGPAGACVADMLTKLDEVSKHVQAALSASLQSLADALVRELNGTMQTGTPPALQIYARGHIGGRGQDGHAGIKGSKGENGGPTNTQVYELGGVYTTPPETCGKKGTKGGGAGDAGHSGDGGKGGTIALQFMKAWPLRIVLFTDGGPGGEAAAPGARGEGGDGGDGAEFLVHIVSTQGNYGKTVTGDNGPRGDQGNPAVFQGAMGNAGAAGSVAVNGAAYSGTRKTVAPLSYDLLAPLLKLEQLLMTQRIAKLVYLNAKAKADYDRVATLFLWLCTVLPDSVTGPTSSIPLDDRTARAAIRDSARVELLRLQRGLDYFGHPYNWAPVLLLKHTQTRVNELIALGQIVEQQYNAYNAENKSVTEKLQALDDTLGALEADLLKSKTAEDALNRQIELTEGAVASLQTDMETQQGVMKRHQQELDQVIQVKIKNQCNLANIFKVVQAVVAIGAGAYNGVTEIAGAAQLEAIFTAAKAAAAGVGQLKDDIESILKATASLQGLAGELGAVDSAIKADKPNSVKIAVVKEEFEETITPLLAEFPAEAKELRGAVRGFLDLAQAHNEKILDYNALFVQKAQIITLRAQIQAQIGSVNAVKSQRKEELVPAPYTTFFRSALTWSKENLIRLLYEETRAFCYHTGAPRKDLVEDLSDLNMATLANAQARLLTDYDQFLESVGRPYGAVTDIKVTISKADDPALFESLASTGRITFTVRYTDPQFAGLTLVKAESVEVHLPGVKGGKADELNVAMTMMGEGAVRPPDKTDEASVVHFNCPPRPVSFKYSFDPDRADPVVQPGQISDSEFAPLSPFTTWTLDFGMKSNLNSFVKFAAVDAIEMHFSGKAFGRRAMMARPVSA